MLLRIGIDPLLVFTVSLKRGDLGTHLTFSLRTFSYAIHCGMSVVNREQDQ